MRFNSAVVLSTLAVGQAAAAVSNKHASFHARRSAESGTPDYNQGVDYTKLDYSKTDFTGVDWNAAWRAGQGYSNNQKEKATSQPAAAAQTPSAVAQKAAPSSAAAVVAAAYTPAPAASSASASKPSSQASSGNAVNDIKQLVSGVSSFLSKLGVTAPENGGATSNSAEIYMGDGGNWKATFTNNKNEDVILVCWDRPGMWINTHTPLIAIKLGHGQSKTLSFNEGASGGCGPFYGSTGMNYGMLWNTIFEFTFQSGAGGFDVSREVNMDGDYISAKGQNSGCFSDNDNCVFKCTNGKNTCGDPGTYDLFNRGHNCNGGPAAYGDTGGSCELRSVKSEHIDVTFG